MGKNALLSVYDKDGIVEFGQELIKLGWTLWASGGTAKKLEEAKVPVKDVAELVGGSAILGHKVVTLSREIHAGLLADDSLEENKELEDLGIPRIDLVYVSLYPLEDAIKNSGDSEEVLKQTDIGGPTMLRSAAKGRRIVIVGKDQAKKVIDWLKDGEPDTDNFRKSLAANVEAIVADYCLKSAQYTSDGYWNGSVEHKVAVASYGENPWQENAALYSCKTDDPLALSKFEQIQGVAPSYNNYADFDRLLQTITHIAAGWDKNLGKVPAIAVGGKHGNACGGAVNHSPAEALRAMLDGDLRAIFGGVIMTNFEITAELAEIALLYKVNKGRRLLDAVVAPSITDEALELLKRKKDKCRVLTNPALANLNINSLDSSVRTRYVRSGKLVQSNYTYVLDLNDSELEKKGEAKDGDIIIAWAIGSTSNSNTITLVKDGQLIGNGVGQQDRVGAAQLAVKRATDAKHDIKGSTAYSDSFFPFPDGPQSLADAGVKSIIASSGSVGDNLVKEAMESAGVALYLIPDKKARGFYAH